MIKSKKAYDIPFSLIFSIIAGAFILVIAIYAATSLAKNSSTTSYSQNAQAISNYLNPAVSGLASSLNPEPITFNKETRIYLNCSKTSTKSYFGKQSLSFSEQSTLVKKWLDPGLEITRYNKYIFANNINQGKRLFIITLPLYVGFKVDDLVLLSFDNYCFVNAPEAIKEEILGINNDKYNNLNVTDNVNQCNKKSIKVCFDDGSGFNGCNITVYGECSGQDCITDYDYGYIMKNNKKHYYFKNLLYSSVFSSSDIYECNIKRLSNKIVELSKIYYEKIEIVKFKNQNSNLQPYLAQINNLAIIANSSEDLLNIYLESKEMDKLAYQEASEIYFPDSIDNL